MSGDSDHGFSIVVVGNADNSLLYWKVAMSEPPIGDRMPPAGSYLTSTEIRLIRDWIDQGAKDN